MVSFLRAAVLSLAVSVNVAAQSSTASTPDTLRSTIDATVRDSLGYPVTGASVFITPGGLIYRTDSAGRFSARGITGGALTIGIRKVGFTPLQSRAYVNPGVDLTLDLVMDRLPQMLAEIEVKAERQCDRYSLHGILCRTEQGRGHFMNRQEIVEASKDIYHANLVLRDAPGFRQNLNGSGTTVESTVGWRCWHRIVDGGFPGAGRNIHRPNDIFAIEIYQPPDIPLEYRHWYWGSNRTGKHAQPCTLVVMWSMAEAQRQLKRLAR